MIADTIVVLVLLLVGWGLQRGLRRSFFPTRPEPQWFSRSVKQPWMLLAVLALLISLGGWVDRVIEFGVSDTLKTAAGGPTSWEFERCRSLLPALQKCPYGARVETNPLRCTLHGAPHE